MIYWILFGSTFIYVTLKAFQQLNVQHDQYKWVPPACFGMALCEVITLTHVIKEGSLWAAVPIGVGAMFGCWLAMWAHRKLRQRGIK